MKRHLALALGLVLALCGVVAAQNSNGNDGAGNMSNHNMSGHRHHAGRRTRTRKRTRTRRGARGQSGLRRPGC